MARTRTSLAGLFARLLAPVADAIRAETRRTCGELVATLMRAVPSRFNPTAVAVAAEVKPVPSATVGPVPTTPDAVPASQAPPASLGWRPLGLPARVASAESQSRAKNPARKSRKAAPKAVPVTGAVRATKKPAARKAISKPPAKHEGAPKAKTAGKGDKPAKRKAAKA